MISSENVKYVVDLRKIVAFAIALSLVLAVGYGICIEPYWVDVSHLWIKSAGLNQVLAGKTAVHLSDLHISRLGRRERTVLRILQELKPDILFLTGDYVPWNGDYEPALSFLSKLRAPLGIWAVVGDSDYHRSRESCRFCHEPGSGKPTTRHQVQFLRNSVERVDLPEGTLWIRGIDQAPESLSASKNVPISPTVEEPAIVLCHSPFAFDLIERDRDVLILAGDTHGGQIALPTWLWRIAGSEKCAQYNRGLFQDGLKRMYVSRGVGTSHLPLRFFRRPEVVVVHFEP